MTCDAETLEMLAAYECTCCGPLVDEEGNTHLTQEEADIVICGDLETGERRCPDCDEEVEETLGSLLDFAKMVAERIPSLAPKIAEEVASALNEVDDRG